MTTHTPDLTVTSTAQFVAMLPHLIGFPPVESLVIAWAHTGTIVVAARVDLPDPGDVGRITPAEVVESLAPGTVPVGSAAFIALCTTEGADALAAHVRLVDGLRAELVERRVEVYEVAHVFGDRWRSLLCVEADCCPVDGHVVDDDLRALVAEEFLLAGRTVVADRAAVVAQVAADVDAIAQVEPLLPPRPRRARRGDAWRDRAIDRAWRLLTDGPAAASPPACATVLHELADVRVRDTVLWELAHAAADDVERAAVALCRLTRSAPDVVCAPVATCCAIAAWLTGDGVLARAALDRALAAEPGYSLAQLADTALRAGLPPSHWRGLLAEVGRAACRGAGAAGPRAEKAAAAPAALPSTPGSV